MVSPPLERAEKSIKGEAQRRLKILQVIEREDMAKDEEREKGGGGFI
jgi:hypothetical protein